MTGNTFCTRCGHRFQAHFANEGECLSRETKAVARGKASKCGCPRFAPRIVKKEAK